MNLQHANLNRLDVACKDLRDLKGLGPLVASERSEDATAQGPRPFKSRRSLRATSNLYLSSLYLLSTLDVIPVTFWTRLSPPFLSGGSKVIHRIICAEEGEPGNEAISMCHWTLFRT